MGENNTEDAYWDSLFAMADNYDVQEDYAIYENDELNGNIVENIKSYNSPEEALKNLFGYETFRPGQKSVIDSIMSGRDVFAVMPTGAGKSVCYQIPAMLLSGITLVISPLISLMQDQVKELNEAGVQAAFINSALSANEYYNTVDNARHGKYKIIYVAPERLMTDEFLEFAAKVDISMVTVDEAHCISQWGQDFRPSYMKIVEFVKRLEKRPVISAFTATATENVREDIVCTLGLNNPYILVNGFNRENLYFQVEKPQNKNQYVLDYIAEHADESGIIYCATRKNVDNLYDLLRSRGISVAKYHAGMTAEERKKMQDDFVFDYISIVVATNAFGMGINKSNVRYVIHYNMPQSMENYYQEAGRAGRDGLEARCILLFSPQDMVINRFLLEHKEMAELEPAEQEIVRERDAFRLQVMEKYCYTPECLRNYILKYFGEKPEKPCEDCGNCQRDFETVDMTEAAKKVINCVYEAKGRYGKNIIIDAVSGAKTPRLEEVGAVNYKSYGVLAGTNKTLLRRLVEQMIAEGYLEVGDYQTIKLADINRLKNPDTQVLVRITDEEKKPVKSEKANKSKGMEALSSAGRKLFDKLRALRLEIAREENMPPYIVFNDKTLIDMAAKVPLSKAEMLEVSGVGENKYAKYGERFISVIKEHVGEYQELMNNRNSAELSQKIMPQFARTELLLGEEAMERLRKARVAVFGVGGVGGHVVEALARSGVGTLDIIDDDLVSITNINRQIIATMSSVGRPKVEVMKERIADINPEAVVNAYKTFYVPENAAQFDFTQYDYVVDAIDTVTGKIALVMQANEAGTPIISSMGAGNKLDATAFKVADIYKTSVCPLAKVMRKELKERGIKKLKVVYSEELPIKPVLSEEMRQEMEASGKRQLPGSCAFIPSVAGLIIAGEVIKDICMK